MKYRVPKLVILIIVLYAMVRMWHWKIGFTFFTQLSNLWIAGVVLAQLLAGEGKLKTLKYSAVVSITITFFIYLVVLGPVIPGGILAAYRQDHYASLCMHVLVPAAAVTDYWMNDRGPLPVRNWLLGAVMPPVVWFAFILLLGAAGVRWHGMAAPYPFLNYLSSAGWLGFVPETAGFAGTGIGVLYSLIAMLLLFVAAGWMIRRMGTGGGTGSGHSSESVWKHE